MAVVKPSSPASPADPCPYTRSIASHRAISPAPPSRAGHAFRLAVVDDDQEFISPLTKRAEALGWRVERSIAEVAPSRLAATKVDALLLDPQVLGKDGERYLDALCEALPELSLLVCTGRASRAARVRALRAGVDDWLTKPFHPEEALARVEAVSRRRRHSAAPAGSDPFFVGELEVVPDYFQAFVDGEGLQLTRREFELLHLLARAHDQVLEREVIYQRVWGYAMPSGDRSVDVFVRKLRQKLKAGSPAYAYIHTHFGIGYRLAAAPVGEPRPGDPLTRQPAGEAGEGRALVA